MTAMRVGLVLGGGGVTGLAYHAAALAAIEHDLGWDPRTADIVVGTSAGSIVAAMLRRGVPASDLSTIAVGGDPTATPAGIVRALRDRPELPPVGLSALVGRLPRLPSVSILAAWARRPWRVDPISAVASVIPDGTLDIVEHASALDEILGSRWPDDATWICTVRQKDLRRIVLGRDVDAPLAPAVAASCAIPGYFRPVTIGEHSYVDGGVRSPTNADVLSHAPELDLAIVVSPMSGRDLGLLDVRAIVRRHARARLDGERKRLEAAGIPTVVIEPGPEAIAALGTDFMSDAGIRDIVPAVFLDTGDQLRRPDTARRLAGLVDHSRRQAEPPGRRRRARRPVSRPRRRRAV
jgi:NTE family protein